MSCGKTVLEINGLKVTLKSKACETKECCNKLPLVNDVSLAVSQGEVTGLIGESGSGKSLTCLSVMNLLPDTMVLDKGRITIAGSSLEEFSLADSSTKNNHLKNRTQNLTSQWRCFRGRRAAMILQNPMSCFDPIFTIGYHIKETISAHGLDWKSHRSKVDSTLCELGFESPNEILSAYPFQLSGGMLQRIMVSLALLLEAELLIADEPTTDLDVIVQARILDIIDKMRKEKNVGVLLVTHDLSVIARLADNVSVMQNGAVVESGKVEDIFHRPKAAYTKALLDAHFSLYGSNINEVLL
ncbi:MAG: ABC transporter ATP-binding protein [Desulfamplus sp.]|nr:ABC transporter ATP-binding protein [Desulfamplus sp.]